MNYSEALSYIFRDKEWIRKVAIGGLSLFIVMVTAIFFFAGFFAIGYYIAVLRHVINGEEKTLPEWENNWNKFFADGLLGAIIMLINFLVMGGLCALVIVNIAMLNDLETYEKVLGIVFTSLGAAIAFVLTTNLCFIQFAQTNDFAAAFRFSELLALLKNDWSNYLTIVVFVSILNAILFVAGIIIFAPFTNFWGYLVQAHLFDQYARRANAAAPALQIA